MTETLIVNTFLNKICKMSVRRNLRRQNVLSAKCLSAKCLSAKCLSAKCPGTNKINYTHIAYSLCMLLTEAMNVISFASYSACVWSWVLLLFYMNLFIVSQYSRYASSTSVLLLTRSFISASSAVGFVNLNIVLGHRI